MNNVYYNRILLRIYLNLAKKLYLMIFLNNFHDCVILKVFQFLIKIVYLLSYFHNHYYGWG